MVIIIADGLIFGKAGGNMSKEALIIAILVALIILWITETLGMSKTSRLLSGVIDLGFAILR